MVRFMIAFLGVLYLGVVLIVDNLPKSDSELILFIQFLAIFATSFYLAQIFSMAKAKVVLEKEGIQHIWERRFVLSREKNYTIPWNKVDTYVFEQDKTFDSFIINFTNKTRYKIVRLNILPIKDDFYQLVKEFPELSNNYKNELYSDSEIKLIREGKSFYESKGFRMIYYFLLIGFLILTVTKITNPNSETSWSSLMIIGSALVFYGIMINRKKKNK